MTNFKFHLDLERSNFKSDNLEDLEPLLAAWLNSEGESHFNKTEAKSEDLTNEQKEEIYIDEIEGRYIYEGQKVVKIHFYNRWAYIIETE